MTVVEVFADISCPFAHVGLHRIVQAREERGATFDLHVRAWPLELVNGAPLAAAGVAEKITALRATVASDLFREFDPHEFPLTSLPAMALVAAAYRKDAATGERASLAIRDALFEDGIDISRASALQRIAARVGVHVPLDAEDDVIADWREGCTRRVQGSPHFFVDGHDYFCPTLRIDHPDGRLAISVDREAFEGFLDECIEGGREPAPA